MSTTLVSADMSTIDFTATTTARAVNALFQINDVTCIAKVAIAAAGTGAVWVSGRHSLTKKTDKPISTLFDKAYFAAGSVTTVATNNTLCGRFASTATTAQTAVEVFLNMVAGA
jgi:predicted RecA/RadA family phage recombinase